jgi:hypothetical protein
MGNTFSCNDLLAWFVQIGKQCSGWVMKFVKDRLRHSFTSGVPSAPASKFDMWLRTSHVVLFTLVYIYAGRTRS